MICYVILFLFCHRRFASSHVNSRAQLPNCLKTRIGIVTEMLAHVSSSSIWLIATEQFWNFLEIYGHYVICYFMSKHQRLVTYCLKSQQPSRPQMTVIQTACCWLTSVIWITQCQDYTRCRGLRHCIDIIKDVTSSS